MSQYGYFSRRHVEMVARQGTLFSDTPRSATAVWASATGGEVTVTCVGPTPLPEDSGYSWPDAIPLGEVTHWVRGVAS